MKVLKKIWWIPILAYLLISPSLTSDKVYNGPCRGIRISIIDSLSYKFVTPAQLLTMLERENINPVGTNLNDINLEEIEKLISGVRELKEVEVFYTADAYLHIEADQRDPLFRVITEYGNNYYIDKTGQVIPHSSNYTPRILVVSGHIEVPDSCILGKSIFELDEKETIRQTYSIAEFISESVFWDSIIEQLWFDERADINIVPRLGDHIVRFGNTDNYEQKFNILKTFYTGPLGRVGWNKYKEIDMRFEGQLVCRKN